jgi:hypothetical protein
MQTCTFRSLPVKTLFTYHGEIYLKISRCKKHSDNLYIGLAKPISKEIFKAGKLIDDVAVTVKKRGRPRKVTIRPFAASIEVAPLPI